MEGSTIALRGFQDTQPPQMYEPSTYPVSHVLCFDTETDLTPAQNLRVGCYIDRQKHGRTHLGLFYNERNINSEELATLKLYCQKHTYELITAWQFDYYLARLSNDDETLIVGFNLPFDISRIATRCHEGNGAFRNGFTFDLATSRVRVKVKHLSARKSLIQWGGFGKKKAKFVDVMTLGAAMLGRSHSLASLAKTLKVTHQKAEATHGETLSESYLNYLCSDVRATLDCFDTLSAEYATYRLDTPIHSIYSEASLGKAYLRQMGVYPHRLSCPDFPAELTGRIMSTYYGGRSEVHIRHRETPVIYTDFLSMYPTVCSLMHLWKFVIAESISYSDSTTATRELLSRGKTLGPELLVGDDKADVWKSMCTLVKVRPVRDLFPVRSKYNNSSYTIGLNYLTCSPLWYTLADCLVSVFLTGKVPEVLEAVTFEPGPPQEGLRSLDLLGQSEYHVNPYRDDFYRRLIELRAASTGPAKQAIKIIANSTCYGIFVEVTPEKLDKGFDSKYYSWEGKGYERHGTIRERTGAYYHPLLASLITGAARLLLGTAERLGKDRGIDWVFCDTDSMAFSTSSLQDILPVVGYFERLSPYHFSGSILKVEELPGNVEGRLRCYGVSAKRYALFERESGRVLLRKASAHGLGFLQRPYGQGQTETTAPEWINDLWVLVVESQGKGPPDYESLPLSKRPAVSQYSLTTGHLYRMMKGYNARVSNTEQVRPFGFMASYLPKMPNLSPVGPLSMDGYEETLKLAFDRTTGVKVRREQLRSYSDVLEGFERHPEAKFVLGDCLHGVECQRRHVIVSRIEVIGKESNRVDPEGWREKYEPKRHKVSKVKADVKYILLK